MSDYSALRVQMNQPRVRVQKLSHGADLLWGKKLILFAVFLLFLVLLLLLFVSENSSVRRAEDL